jgi:hypothetical protein
MLRNVDEVARALARAVLGRAGWTEPALAAHLREALASDRRETIVACCRAACEDCRHADPQLVEEEGAPYYLHQEPGVDLLIECRSGDIRAALLDG